MAVILIETQKFDETSTKSITSQMSSTLLGQPLGMIHLVSKNPSISSGELVSFVVGCCSRNVWPGIRIRRAALYIRIRLIALYIKIRRAALCSLQRLENQGFLIKLDSSPQGHMYPQPKRGQVPKALIIH